MATIKAAARMYKDKIACRPPANMDIEQAFIAGAKWIISARSAKNYEIALDSILNRVCSACSVSANEVCSESRVRRIADSRKLFCYLARTETPYIYKKIGEFINQSHSSVIHNYQQALALIDSKDKEFSVLYAKAKELKV